MSARVRDFGVSAMYISKFQVSNYKSFRDTVEITLTPGINIITGQNNVGKTALLEALSRDKGASRIGAQTASLPGRLSLTMSQEFGSASGFLAPSSLKPWLA